MEAVVIRWLIVEGNLGRSQKMPAAQAKCSAAPAS